MLYRRSNLQRTEESFVFVFKKGVFMGIVKY